MTQPELPLTVHEYGEWGDPADPAVLKQARVRQLLHAECLTVSLPERRPAHHSHFASKASCWHGGPQCGLHIKI